MLMTAAPSMTLAKISGASERERERESRHAKDSTKFLIFSSVTSVTHFMMVMVVLFDFHGQRMCEGHHPESD